MAYTVDRNHKFSKHIFFNSYGGVRPNFSAHRAALMIKTNVIQLSLSVFIPR